jgi:hypothetical protein
MKKLTLVLASVFAMAAQSMANGYANINSYADAFVFDEMGITFSVYPDGEFDFYLPADQQSTTVSNGFVNVTFNSGYNYDPYVQYDDFGAVIQVENVPIWYDAFGRVDQIGDVRISYRSQRVCQVGGLYVYYNPYGQYAYHTGFINTWNPYFVYRPYYVCFARPVINLCFVRTVAYRQYYTPVRYAYYRPYVQNVRPCYATVGHTYRPSGYGMAHHRYTQTASAGERPVTRSRQTVTTDRVRAQYGDIARANMVDRRSANDNRSTYSRSDVQKPQDVRNASAVNDRSVVNSDRSTNLSESGRSATTQRPTATNPGRSAQVAPTRSGSTNVNAGVAPSRNSGVGQQIARPSTVERPSSPSRSTVNSGSSVRNTPNTATSRPSVNQAPSRNVPSQAPRNTSTVERQQPNSGSSVSRTAPNSSSRPAVSTSNTRSGSATVGTPSRSSSLAAPASRGTSSKGSENKER